MAKEKIEIQLEQLADLEAKILQRDQGRPTNGIVSTQVQGLMNATGKILAALVKRMKEAGI